MTNLTEQWKKGKLDHGWYYIKYRGAYKTDQWQGYYWENSWNENVEEVIAPVPSYEEWREEQKSLKVLAEAYCKEKEENQQLKELLKECREEIDKAKNILTEDTNIDNTVVAHATLRKILAKIDNAIGEKK